MSNYKPTTEFDKRLIESIREGFRYSKDDIVLYVPYIPLKTKQGTIDEPFAKFPVTQKSYKNEQFVKNDKSCYDKM